MDILIGILEQGLLYGLLAIGIYITYIILNFPDLTVDSSFPLGAAVTVKLISMGINPWLSLIPAFLAGVVAGLVTGIIHVKFKIKDLLSGIITMTGLYTINLTIAGQANLPIFQQSTIFNTESNSLLPEAITPFSVILIALPIVLLCKYALDIYLKTKSGLLLRAVGDNQNIATILAVDSDKVKVLGLAIANGLVALSGAIVGQQQRFFEISMGTGTMVMGLASVIIGLKVFDRIKRLAPTTKALFGSVLYKGVVALAIALGLSAQSMKLLTAVILFIVLIASRDEENKVAYA